ncbi:DUF4129 domain-containing protein [Maribacter sp. 2307UL18-2]|uniref:DUF4129 domain-containing protein n=1 Tax=Maribacter sp. 2307UL18-2 TaxID=3386274 RepID=UPI0039BD054B
MQRLYFLFFLVFYVLVPGHAQEDSLSVNYDTERVTIQKISDGDLEKFKKDPKFDYEIVESNPTWWDDFKAWLGNLFLRFFEWIFGVDEAAGALALFLRILPYLLLVLLLFLFIRFFMNANMSAAESSSGKKPLVSLSEEEHIIKNEDIQALIQKALDSQNYRLAVRYYYLYVLQLLSEKKFIDWQLQKTNHDYEKEIKKPDLKKAFTKITRIYDYIWYGDFDIDQSQYEQAEIIFSDVRKTLNNA